MIDGKICNPDNSAFQGCIGSRICVDKTGMIEYMNRVLETTDAYIFGKQPGDLGNPMRRICLQHITAKVQILR